MSSTVLLESHLKTLKLPSFVKEYRQAARQCAEKDEAYEEFLLRLAEREVATREANAVIRRVREAEFPAEKDLAGFDFTAAPKLNKKRILELARCEFVEKRENIVPLGQGGAENFFNFFSACYERTSLIVTTNLPFSEWPQVFGDERLTGALIDRLTHRVHIIEIQGESWRLKDGLARQKGGESANQ